MQSMKSNVLQLKEEKELNLYSIDGNIVPLKKFIFKNIGLLSSIEKEFIENEMNNIKEEKIVLQTLLSRTKQFFNGKKIVPAFRGGTRSAYIKDTNFKLKGCRPENSTFPHWDIDDKFNLVIEKIPFGTLSKRAVIGEVLAFLFMRKYNIEISSKPICVFHYNPNGKDLNYALLQEVQDDSRVEKFIDSVTSVHDIIRIKRKKSQYTGEEVTLNSIDKNLYLERKVELLLKFNFNGGFRGILNSNIGNDVVRNKRLHSICDFYTFTIRKIPEPKDKNQIRNFTITAFLELIKTSLPFVDYIDLERNNESEMHRILTEYYKKHSSLYLLYSEKFIDQTSKLNWNKRFVKKYIDETFQTPTSFELLQELIPNSFTFKSYNHDSIYVPHN